MASEKSRQAPDPLGMWREWVDQAERQWNAVLNEVMASEQYGQASSKVMEALLGVQASMNEATQRYLSPFSP